MRLHSPGSEPSVFGWKEQRCQAREGGRRCDEWEILEKDRRQNVIRSLPEVILLERKNLASKPSTPGTTEGGKIKAAKKTLSVSRPIQTDERTGALLQQKACQTEFGGCAKLGKGGRGGSEAERQRKEHGLLSFVLSVMKLKEVERLCREVWRSCQQVCLPPELLHIYIYKLSICVLIAI